MALPQPVAPQIPSKLLCCFDANPAVFGRQCEEISNTNASAARMLARLFEHAVSKASQNAP
eukprot:3209867-Prorocentrum_lima.AAC.1